MSRRRIAVGVAVAALAAAAPAHAGFTARDHDGAGCTSDASVRWRSAGGGWRAAAALDPLARAA